MAAVPQDAEDTIQIRSTERNYNSVDTYNQINETKERLINLLVESFKIVAIIIKELLRRNKLKECFMYAYLDGDVA